MASHPDDKKNQSPYDSGKGRVTEDDSGRGLWEGSSRTVSLSLMKTEIFGSFSTTESQGNLAKEVAEEELDLSETDSGFNSRETTSK